MHRAHQARYWKTRAGCPGQEDRCCVIHARLSISPPPWFTRTHKAGRSVNPDAGTEQSTFPDRFFSISSLLYLSRTRSEPWEFGKSGAAISSSTGARWVLGVNLCGGSEAERRGMPVGSECCVVWPSGEIDCGFDRFVGLVDVWGFGEVNWWN